MLQLGDRVRRPHVLFAAHAEGVFAARVERAVQHRIVAERRAWMRIASSATSNTPMPSTFEVVPVKYLSTSSLDKPTASKICAPV